MFEELKTIDQIKAKKMEYRSMVERAETAEDLERLEAEARELDKREKEVRQAEVTKAKRAALMASLNGETESASATVEVGGNPVEKKETRSRADILASKEYRSAFAKKLMGLKLTEAEQRAADVAITTTSTVYTAGGEEVDGVNNGGLLVPSEVSEDLLKILSMQSPIFRDVKKTNIVGVVKFPYKKSISAAERKGSAGETVKNKDAAIEWGTLELKTAEVTITVKVSWKLEAMTADDFIAYLKDELREQMAEAKIEGVIYGAGNNSDMEGITVNAIKKQYTKESSTPLSAIETNLAFLPAKKKIGAKIYISTTAAEAVQFAKDSNGNYIYNPAFGLPKNFAGYALEVDPFLKDGDIVIGNVNRYARLNVVEAMTIVKEIKGSLRQNEYTAYEVCGSAAQPNCLLYIEAK